MWRRIAFGHGVSKRAVLVIGRADYARDFRKTVVVSRRAYVELEVACRNVKLAVVRDAFILCNRDAFGQRQFISKRDIIGRGVSQAIAVVNRADVIARNRADACFAARLGKRQAILNRALIPSRNAADESVVAADCAFNCAVFYRAVVLADNAADIITAADVDVLECQIFNRAVTVEVFE